MANVFGILTAIVLALASFVAYKNKAAYEIEISGTANEKSTLGKSQVRLKTAQESLAKTTAERIAVDAEVVKQTDLETAQKKTNETLTQENKAKSDKVGPNKVKLDAIREKTAKVGDLTELASKMRTTKAELEEIAQSITTAEAKLANLTAQNNQAEKLSVDTKAKFERFTTGQSLPTLKTRIRTIYPTWGFVTLASGNNEGVVANSTLEVVRDGSTIAKLLVTSVETGTASASIMPDSISQDVTLMIGDQVIPSVKAVSTPVAPKRVDPVTRPAVTTPDPTATDPTATPDPTATDPTATPAVTPDPAATPAVTPDPAATPAATADPAATPAAEATPAPATN